MAFSLFSFNYDSIKSESMKYFEKRSSKMYSLRYRCPNEKIFDPQEHLSSLKSFFPKKSYSNFHRKNVLEYNNSLAEDLLRLKLTEDHPETKAKTGKNEQKNYNSKRQNQKSNYEQKQKSNFFDDISQSVNLLNSTNNTLKLVFKNIKERNYSSAFSNINKTLTDYYQANELQKCESKMKQTIYKNDIILYAAFIGLMLSYSLKDEDKQNEYLDVISDYPIESGDLSHFYHLVDEVLLANNGIKQLTLSSLLGFPNCFFVDERSLTDFKNFRVYDPDIDDLDSYNYDDSDSYPGDLDCFSGYPPFSDNIDRFHKTELRHRELFGKRYLDRFSSKRCQISENRKQTDIKKSIFGDSGPWKIITKGKSDTLFDEILIAPIMNVTFRKKTKNVDQNSDSSGYYAYKMGNGSQISNCNFVRNPDFPINCALFDDKCYNYCCLPHYQKMATARQFRDFFAVGEEYAPFYSKYAKMKEMKNKIKQVNGVASNCPVPKLECSFSSDDENDESLTKAIELATKKPKLLIPSNKADFSFQNHEIFQDDFNEIEDDNPLFFKHLKLNEYEEGDTGLNLMNCFNNNNNFFSQIHSNIKHAPETKTTTEIKKNENGTTIITTTSKIKYHTSSTSYKTTKIKKSTRHGK